MPLFACYWLDVCLEKRAEQEGECTGTPHEVLHEWIKADPRDYIWGQELFLHYLCPRSILKENLRGFLQMECTCKN